MHRTAANTFWGACTLVLLSIFSIGAWAQTTHEIDVNQGKVVYAQGNDLVVKMADGTLELFWVPIGYKVSVDGKQVAVQDLKPGTVLTQSITTTRQVYLITDIRTVDAKVLEVKPESHPPTLTVSSGDKIRHYEVPEGTRFTLDGKEMTLTDLQKDMNVKGTLLTTIPKVVTTAGTKVTGEAPKNVATPTLVGILLIEVQ